MRRLLILSPGKWAQEKDHDRLEGSLELTQNAGFPSLSLLPSSIWPSLVPIPPSVMGGGQEGAVAILCLHAANPWRDFKREPTSIQFS